MTSPALPPYSELLWPTLRAVCEIGDSGTIQEIVDKVIENEGFSEAQQAIPHGSGRQTEIEYRLAWARTYLKGMGALENSRRGVWSTTDAGRGLTEEQIPALHADYTAALRAGRKQRRRDGGSHDGDSNGEISSQDWKESVLAVLLGLPPENFERLARRLLREAGFISATVTGRSGDGGIDGIGIYRLSLVSFQVFFQCKRYRGSVGAGAVRDFRGAMYGRGDKGLLITTGSFTADAKQEATRDGAPPIDLIDGDRLCELLKDYEMGLRTTVRQIEDVEVDAAFFEDL